MAESSRHRLDNTENLSRRVTEGMEAAEAGAPDAAWSWRAGDLLPGDFEVLRLLGRGGMGEVYLVQHANPVCPIQHAVKILRRDLLQDPGQLQNCLNELSAWIGLPHHPNITRCLFIRSIDRRVAVFHEYVHGGSLLDWIRSRRIPDPQTALEIIIQVARGLECAHGHGVIHQDIKPGNILVTGPGIAKITDFGLAGVRRSGSAVPVSVPNPDPLLVTVNGLTPAYCSPEQLQGLPVGPASDIWSLAATMLHLFAGKLFWNIGVILAEAFDQAFRSGWRDFLFPLPASLVPVMRRCFEPEPCLRWQCAGEFGDALEHIRKDLFGVTRRVRVRPGPVSTDLPVPSGAFRAGWSDPVDLRQRVMQKNGVSLPAPVPRVERTVKAQAISDLRVLDEWLEAFGVDRVPPDPGSADTMMALLSEKAAIQVFLSDSSGVAATFGVLRNACLNASIQWKGPEWGQLFIKACNRYMSYLMASEQPEVAVRVGEAADSDMRRLPGEFMNDPGFLRGIMEFHQIMGFSLSKQSRHHDALRHLERGLSVLDSRHTGIEPAAELRARRHFNYCYAVTLRALGRMEDAEAQYLSYMAQLDAETPSALHDENALSRVALAISLGDLYSAMGSWDKEWDLYCRAEEILRNTTGARTDEWDKKSVCLLINMALNRMRTGDYTAAIARACAAETICVDMVSTRGITGMLPLLAQIYLNTAVIHGESGNMNDALAAIRRAVSLYEHLVYTGNELRHRHILQVCYLNFGELLAMTDQHSDAIIRFDMAARIARELLQETGSAARYVDIGILGVHRALSMAAEGALPEARDQAKNGLALIEKGMAASEGTDFKQQLDWARGRVAAIVRAKSSGPDGCP